jgi:Methyltransferase domain
MPNLVDTNTSTSTQPTLRDIFDSGKYLSMKLDNYFSVYEQLFNKYIGKPIVFVEIGVLNGGSLFMWRDYFGKDARIIGVDLNPATKKWEAHGFEIFIGSQSDPSFWEEFFQKVGDVDVILDDGGHTNEQQIVTSVATFGHIRDGGLLVVEDTHASYYTEFGNPSPYSFVNFGKRVVDGVNSRFPSVPAVKNTFHEVVHSVQFFQSFVVFVIDRSQCLPSQVVRNNGESSSAKDFRYEGTLRESTNYYKGRLANAAPLLRPLIHIFFLVPEFFMSIMEGRRVKRFFD